MARQQWLTSEPGPLTGLRQAAELGRRGLRRPWLALLLTVLLASGVAAVVLVVKRSYAPVFMLRVVEADTSAAGVSRQINNQRVGIRLEESDFRAEFIDCCKRIRRCKSGDPDQADAFAARVMATLSAEPYDALAIFMRLGVRKDTGCVWYYDW